MYPLLGDGASAIRELGFELEPYEFTVMENTDSVHNVIVCTLCSCYPVSVLGRPPDWYKSQAYRSRVVRDPRAVLTEFGTDVGLDREIRVHDSTADMRYLVVPMRPDGTDDWSEDQLAEIVTRDAMVGVTEIRLAS